MINKKNKRKLDGVMNLCCFRYFLLFFIIITQFAHGKDEIEIDINDKIEECLITLTSVELKEQIDEVCKILLSLNDIEIKQLTSSLVNNELSVNASLVEFCQSINLYRSKEYKGGLSILPTSTFIHTSHNCIEAYYFEHKGNLHRYLGDYTNSISSFLQSIKAYENLGDFYELSRINYKIGVSNLDIKNYILAEEYLNKAYTFAQKTKSNRLKKTTSITLASCYQLQKKHKKALDLYYFVLNELKFNANDSARVLMNIGSIQKTAGRFSIAKSYYHQSLEIRKKSKDTLGIAKAYNNIGQLHIEMNEYEKALKYIMKSYKYAIKNENNNIALSSSYNLVELYTHLNKSDSALWFLDYYVNLSAQIRNANIRNELLELDKKYKTLEKDNQIAQFQKEDALNQARLKTKNILIVVISCFLVLLLIVGYLINRQRKELVQSRRRLLRQKEDITGMNEQLRVSNLAKERILSVIGHDLRGPVGGLKELIELYMELPEYEPDDIDNLLKSAREASTSTYHLLENLLSWANSQRGEIVFNPVATPLLPLIKQTVQLLDKSINTRHVKFEYDIPKTLVVQVDMNMLRTIIRNLVSNALKYSPENGLITISTEKNKASLHFYVSDQGHGMTAEETQSIFKKKETYFIGSEMTAKGTGLGLILCKEFVERHGGSIWIESEKGVGTKVCFSIPAKGIKTKSVSDLQVAPAQ
ncbi:tetratricopeptide repeat-containing sensor histidine kinase [Carboxylicivirga marina]|uniref:tetratricopeptide repeat-containing sensor histidine kinase n=1 Tax=Carboxylicivirga marina TaxID=2800988 RepID=UPI002592D264|nr:tetratricopeptide repeat-containing sensor histidine kinase [uncultured Carboxylicivirga sp.]